MQLSKNSNPTKNPSKALQQGSCYRVLRPRGWRVEAATAPRSCPSHQQHAPSALGPAPAGVHCSRCALCRQESPSSFHHLPALSTPPTPGRAHPYKAQLRPHLLRAGLSASLVQILHGSSCNKMQDLAVNLVVLLSPAPS